MMERPSFTQKQGRGSPTIDKIFLYTIICFERGNLRCVVCSDREKVLLVYCDSQASLSINLNRPQPDTLPGTLSKAISKMLADQPITPSENIFYFEGHIDLEPSWYRSLAWRWGVLTFSFVCYI